MSIILTWGIGLLPAFIARYWWNKAPLRSQSATWIAGLSCFVFAIAFLILRAALGEENPRISPAWILVFLVSRWIMIRGSKAKRDALIQGLRDMIADPLTTEEKRALAEERLRQLEAGSAKKELAGAGRLPMEQHQPTSHDQSLARSDSGGPEGLRFIPSRARMRGFGRVAAYVLGCAVLLDVVLMLSGYRFLVHEKVVEPGESYATGEWVFGSDERAVIVCSYWTGRSVKPTGLKYGVGNNEIDECPLLAAQDEWK